MAGGPVRHHPPDRHHKFLKDHPDVVQKLVEGQVAANDVHQDQPGRRADRSCPTTSQDHRQADPGDLVIAAFKNLEFTNDPIASSLVKTPRTRARSSGLTSADSLKGIYDLTFLNKVLKAAKQPTTEVRSCDVDACTQRFAGSSTTPVVERFLASAVVLDDVSKVYGTRATPSTRSTASRSTSQPGEFVCLVGASGCGKSTLLNLVAGLDQPTRHGRRRAQPHRADVPGGGAVPLADRARQRRAAAEAPRRCPRAERRPEGRRAARAGAPRGFGDKRPHELSGGMRQRVALARALAQDADVLLMDEPFGALDAMTRDVLHDELERLWSETGLTVIFVTHNVREAARLGDRVVLLSSRPGRVVEEYPGRHRPPAPHRLARGRGARRRRSPTGCGGGAPPWPLTSATLDRLGPRRARGRRVAPKSSLGRARSGRRRGRSCSPSRIVLGVWQLVVWIDWKPHVRASRARRPFSTLFDNCERRSGTAMRPRCSGRSRLRARARHRRRRRRGRRADPGAARRRSAR